MVCSALLAFYFCRIRVSSCISYGCFDASKTNFVSVLIKRVPCIPQPDFRSTSPSLESLSLLSLYVYSPLWSPFTSKISSNAPSKVFFLFQAGHLYTQAYRQNFVYRPCSSWLDLTKNDQSINNPTLTSNLQLRIHRRLAFSLSLFYPNYSRLCSSGILFDSSSSHDFLNFSHSIG